MPAEISISNDGQAEMMYTGAVPWHGLGKSKPEGTTAAEWGTDPMFIWEAKRAEVHYETDEGDLFYMPDRHVLYRSDSKAPLGVVSNTYNIVQPREVIGFFEDITSLGAFNMETAGVLYGGKRIWALAKSSIHGDLGSGDKIAPYLLLATSMDGTLATSASFTTVRVVCNNTLQMALGDDKTDKVKLTHRGRFNPDKVKVQLGMVDDAFGQFMANADRLATKKVTAKQARDFYGALTMGDKYTKAPEPEAVQSITMAQLERLRLSAPGQDTVSARDTAWGLVNSVTYWLDHDRNTKTVDARLNSSWFGTGHNLKQKAMDLALDL